MDSAAFTKLSRKQAGLIASYINNQAPAMVVAKTLRFIDGNFRAQGWQGASFKPWQPQKKPRGQILIKTGALRRGTNYTTNGQGEVRFYNNIIYAQIHNEGGEINSVHNVRGFTRKRYYTDEVSAPGARKALITKTHVGNSAVKAFTRTMKTQMPQRQFAPYEGNESPVMNNAIARELEKKIKQLLTF